MFTGFTPETIDFLWGIRMNNNRDWFLAHKQQYTDFLYEPMKALGADLFEPFREVPGTIVKVSRIYRDARLHHPLPYKESLWICIRRDVEWWAENPCLFFELRPEGASYGFSFWKPKVTAMELFRQRLAGDARDFLDILRDAEIKTGIPVTAQCYKRPKEAPSEELVPYFAWKNDLSCIRTEEVSPALFGPELGERVKQMLTDLIPLYDYFHQFTL